MSAVVLRDVSKAYSVSHEKPALIRAIAPRLLRPRRIETHWALRDVSLEVPAGATLGVMGPNGAGKTTLLAVMAGITAPTRGAVTVRGRIASVLSLGGGFHPELTGLENIFLNGSLLGMRTREIRRKLEAIVAFSQLDGFIDAPLQTYSAGMQLRLGFAIASHADANVLLLDEVLTVGDQAFQAKCLERLQALKRAGTTLVLAAQGHEALRPLADQAVLLHRGGIIARGTVAHVQGRYEALLPWLASPQDALRPQAQAAIEAQVARQDPVVIRRDWGSKQESEQAQIEAVRFIGADGREPAAVASGSAMTVDVQVLVEEPLADPHVGIAIFRDDGTYCYGPNTRTDGIQIQTLAPGRHLFRLHIETLALTPGRYHGSVSMWDALEGAPYAYHKTAYPFDVTGQPMAGVLALTHHWRITRLDRAQGLTPGLTPSLSVEGPLGEQRWYRSFESLRLSAVVPGQPTSSAVVVAECRGPRGELWWASRSPPGDLHEAAADPRWRCEVEFPALPLLTGRYVWTLGWEGAAERLTRTVEIVADRRDHGLIYLPHHWELRPCEAELVEPSCTSV